MKAALIIIDLQDFFLKRIPQRAVLLKHTQFAIQAAQLLEIPAILVNQMSDKLGPCCAELEKFKFTKTFSKASFSALGEETFLSFLQAQGIEHLILAGIELPICIYQTVEDALKFNFKVTVLTDCVGSSFGEDDVGLWSHLEKQNDCIPSIAFFFSRIKTPLSPLLSPLWNL